MARRRVLILCTGNSARSQMAEGLINHFLQQEWHAFSAGTEPSGYVHPLAIRAMKELDIDISSHYSKSTEEFREMALDQVITVCDDALEKCPVWLGAGKVTHIGFPDPAKSIGDELEPLHAFRYVRDAIRDQVLSHLSVEIT